MGGAGLGGLSLGLGGAGLGGDSRGDGLGGEGLGRGGDSRGGLGRGEGGDGGGALQLKLLVPGRGTRNFHRHSFGWLPVSHPAARVREPTVTLRRGWHTAVMPCIVYVLSANPAAFGNARKAIVKTRF